MKYIIISTKTPKEMEELLNSKYKIEALGNTWVTSGTVYQSFMGELKLTTKESIEEIAAIKVDVPKKKKATKRKPKEKKDVPDISK